MVIVSGVGISELSVAELGTQIRDAGKRAGITQTELADLAGTSERTIRAIESGTGNPSLRAVASAAHMLGLDASARPMTRDLQRLKLLRTADVYKCGVLAGASSAHVRRWS